MMEDYDELQDSPELFAQLKRDAASSLAPKPVAPTPALTDSIATSAAAPAPESKIDFDPSKYMVTKDDMDRAAEKKQNIALMGAMTDNLANRQSFGNFFSGKMQPKSDSSALVKSAEDMADQPIAQKQTLMKQEMQKPEVEYMKQAIDPSSEISKASAGIHKSLISSALASPNLDPGLKAVMESAAAKMDGLSAYQQQQFMDKTGLTKILGSEGTSLMKMMAMMPLQKARLDIAQQGLGLKQDNQTVAASAAFDKDPLLQSAARQLNQIGIDRHTLQASVVTPQILDEVSKGISVILNQGKSTGLGESEKQSLATSMTAFAALKQRLLNRPEEGASPEIKAQAIDTLNRLEGALRKVQTFRTQQLKTGRNYAHNPAAQAAQDAKASSYEAGPPDQPSDRVKVSNGKETLSIPRSRVKEAEADKYFEVKE